MGGDPRFPVVGTEQPTAALYQKYIQSICQVQSVLYAGEYGRNSMPSHVLLYITCNSAFSIAPDI